MSDTNNGTGPSNQKDWFPNSMILYAIAIIIFIMYICHRRNQNKKRKSDIYPEDSIIKKKKRISNEDLQEKMDLYLMNEKKLRENKEFSIEFQKLLLPSYNRRIYEETMQKYYRLAYENRLDNSVSYLPDHKNLMSLWCNMPLDYYSPNHDYLEYLLNILIATGAAHFINEKDEMSMRPIDTISSAFLLSILIKRTTAAVILSFSGDYAIHQKLRSPILNKERLPLLVNFTPSNVQSPLFIAVSPKNWMYDHLKIDDYTHLIEYTGMNHLDWTSPTEKETILHFICQTLHSTGRQSSGQNDFYLEIVKTLLSVKYICYVNPNHKCFQNNEIILDNYDYPSASPGARMLDLLKTARKIRIEYRQTILPDCIKGYFNADIKQVISLIVDYICSA